MPIASPASHDSATLTVAGVPSAMLIVRNANGSHNPREAMEIQATLGSDICMLFDECPPYPCEHKYAAKSLALTLAPQVAGRG